MLNRKFLFNRLTKKLLLSFESVHHICTTIAGVRTERVSTTSKADVKKVESEQRYFTEKLSELANFMYQERLERLKLDNQ